MNPHLLISLAAIGAITLLELYALRKGLNGKALFIALALLAGMAGANFKDLLPLLGLGG